jgi:hypothetical protein
MKRFTLDGSEALESRLTATCEHVAEGIRSRIPKQRLDGLILGGGYGRGEGGVFRVVGGSLPYNDLEFYVFLRGNRLLNERRYASLLSEFAEKASSEAGVHVEFKIDALSRLRHGPVSMFSYDLVAGHRCVIGDERLFTNCRQHLEPAKIPLAEATRLLFNRCTGLLLAQEHLRSSTLSGDQVDFIGRNLAKARLALGDAVLTACGQYHWSCRERHARLNKVRNLPFRELVEHHARGVEFKLHPCHFDKSRETFTAEHREISELAQNLWLWLEGRRLNRRFVSPVAYACDRARKCPDSTAWRNLALNIRSFGSGVLLDPMAWRYPRERLFNALSLLLWDSDPSSEPTNLRQVQRQLVTDAADWSGLIAAYKQVWPSYG